MEKIPWRRKWQPTPVFLPGESQAQRKVHRVTKSRTGLKWLTYMLYIPFQVLFHYDLSQDIEYSSLCCRVGPCCLSILCIIVPKVFEVPSGGRLLVRVFFFFLPLLKFVHLKYTNTIDHVNHFKTIHNCSVAFSPSQCCSTITTIHFQNFFSIWNWSSVPTKQDVHSPPPPPLYHSNFKHPLTDSLCIQQKRTQHCKAALCQ